MNLDYLKTINEFVLLGYPQFKLDFSQAKQSSVFDSIEQGKCDTIQALKDTFNLDLTDKEIIAAWNKMILDIPIERIRYIEELKAEGYKIYLFSNINSVHLDQVFNELNRVYSVEKWNKLFDKVFYSFEIGFNKPYADAFEYVLSIVGDRKETLFLDDTKRHVEGALSVGLNAVLIEDGVSIFDTRSIARTIVSGL